jgi:diguanylate cyclase (GGDEF)-like protein
VENSRFNPFLLHFCKELSIRLESLSNRQKTLALAEFAELVEAATHEVLESYSSGEIDLQHYQNSTVFEEYKELAMQSIHSYSESNEKFEKITERHGSLIEESSTGNLINFETITEKFNDIQSHLSDEVSRANQVIGTLMEQIKKLETKTTLDPLTKVYNRYALHEHLKTLLSKQNGHFDIFALMVDVDDFKKINDQFGHIAGDKVLIFIAKLLKKALRDGDRVYRFGGEEFIILLNRTDDEGARMVGERLLSLCRNNKPLFQNQQIAVTLSIGLTKIVSDDTMDKIIDRSDTALYRAKNNGKDRLEMEF